MKELFQFTRKRGYRGSMSISPSPVELRARALTDLRMGLPVVIDMPQPLVVCAAETLTQDRLDALRALGEVQAVLSK